MKKILYSFLIFVVMLLVAVVFAANSSWVIKKAADTFAPDYKISYADITGNIFTGVKILDLKFDGETLSKQIKFSWNPSKILYKRVAINEVRVEDLDVDILKALITSFSNDDNSSSAPLPVVILVDKLHIDVKPFDEQGVHFSKTVIDAEDIMYANDAVGIDTLLLKVDTNITNLLLEASLDNGELIVQNVSVKNIDSEAIEAMFMGDTADDNVSKTAEAVQVKSNTRSTEEMNPLVPTKVRVEKFIATLKPRVYKTAKIKTVRIQLNGLDANIEQIMADKKESIAVEHFALLFDSNVSHLNVAGKLVSDTLTIKEVTLKEVNALALQTLFAPEHNATEAENIDENATSIENDKKNEEKKEPNPLIPKYVVLDALNVYIKPVSYDPVDIITFLLQVKNVRLDTQNRLIKEGFIDLNTTTNLFNVLCTGKVKDNQLLGDIVATPLKALFALYDLPVRREAIGDITIDIDASEKYIVADLKASAKQLLTIDSNSSSEENASNVFNVDIDSLLSHIVYTIKDNTVTADTKIMVTTPYAKDISLTNTFVMDKNISYSGEVKFDHLVGIDTKMAKPLNHFKLAYEGTLDAVNAKITSEGLVGELLSSDLKKGHFHLETLHAIEVDKMFTLPSELNGSKVNVSVDVPLDFAAITPLNAKVKVTSNISNIDADIHYGDTLKANITHVIPANSLLTNFDKNVHWNALSPMTIEADLVKNNMALKLKSKVLSSDLSYGLENGKVSGIIRLAGVATEVKGSIKEKISIDAKVNSIETLLKSVQSLYALEDLPPIRGTLNLSAKIVAPNQAELSLSSPQIVYVSSSKAESVIDNAKIVLSADASKVALKSYTLSYDGMKIFSTKPSLVTFEDDNINISELWINDQLKVVGTYNTKTKKGNISADANTLHIAHKMIDLDSAIHIKTALEGEKTSINGKVVLMGGNIHYDLGSKSYPSDSDILIVQDMKEEKASPFMDNLSMLVNISTKKPLIYKQGPIDIQAKVDLGIHKAQKSDLQVLGEVVILKGGSYTFEGKRFVLDRSNIYFTGDPNKPLLDISIKYKSLNHLITILVSGTPSTPNITFSSVPSLSREQILSLILFDSESGAGTNSGEDMMKMMGGAIAKSALNDLGVKLDHLVIGEGNSVEVGKKLNDKTTVVYINGEIPKIEVRYKYSPSIDVVMGASETSNSLDVDYKKDFSIDSDIVIQGK